MGIIEIKTYLKDRAKINGDTLDIAVESLAELTSQGVEYPSAEHAVLNAFSVSQEELSQAYENYL